MTWKSLMVHMELGGDNAEVLGIAADLVRRFEARVIGIAACKPMELLANEGFNVNSVVVNDREEIEREISAVEKQFHSALERHVTDLEWRSLITYGSLADALADEARSADVVITAKDIGPDLFDETRRVNIGDLVMRAGRPILLVPKGVRSLPMRHVFVGWKESREARRAAVDALPLLRQAQHVSVVEIADAGRAVACQKHVDDVAGWFGQHGISAVSQALGRVGGETGFLRAELLDRHCDLLVAGAYGRPRLQEWMFGGVTRDILLNPDFCVLISH